MSDHDDNLPATAGWEQADLDRLTDADPALEFAMLQFTPMLHCGWFWDPGQIRLFVTEMAKLRTIEATGLAADELVRTMTRRPTWADFMATYSAKVEMIRRRDGALADQQTVAALPAAPPDESRAAKMRALRGELREAMRTWTIDSATPERRAAKRALFDDIAARMEEVADPGRATFRCRFCWDTTFQQVSNGNEPLTVKPCPQCHPSNHYDDNGELRR